MRSINAALAITLLVQFSPGMLFAQPPQPAASAAVPRLINISGVFAPADRQPLGREVVTLAVYTEETGGEPLWQETQSIDVEASGRYALLLGATQADGVPLDVFASGEARWLGILWTHPGEVEGPRMRLTSVPYALRAADAETLGGRPASAYVLSPAAGGEPTADRAGASGTTVTPAGVNPGTTNFLAKYVNSLDVGNSNVYEVDGRVGINTIAPKDILHAAFTNITGQFTGVAVQNFGSTPASYSGMLFYDQFGTLAQFQGFNNISHEYRINNIAPGGFINFMVGSTSRFTVLNNGRIGVNTLGTISGDPVGARGQATGWRPPGASASGGVFVEGGVDFGESGGFFADSDTATIWSPGDADILRVYDEDTLSTPHDPALTIPRFVVTDLGDVRIGAGVGGCVMDADSTIIAGTCVSDERLKKDLRPFDGAMLERALKLRPVYYRWRQELAPDRLAPISGEAYGLIAQDVEKVYPEMVTTDAKGYKAVDYGRLQYVLLEALKEEHTKVEALDSEVTALRKRLATLETALGGSRDAMSWLVLAGLSAVGVALIGLRQKRA